MFFSMFAFGNLTNNIVHTRLNICHFIFRMNHNKNKHPYINKVKGYLSLDIVGSGTDV